MAAEVAIAVCTKIVEYTMKPILSPIVRPFKYLLEYRSNLESLPIKMEVLDTKVAEVQGYTVQGANHLQAVQDWNDRVTEISNEVATITDPETPQQSMNCGQRFSCSNLKQRCLHRKDVAGALEKIDLLNNEATKSENEWKDKSNLQNLMKLKEDLEAARDERKNSIKEGEEALPDAKKWLGKVDNLIVEISNTIRSQPPTRQCCKRFTCLKCYDRRQDVDRKLNEVRRLLEQGSGFEVFSGPTEETKYKRSLDDLKKEVEELKVERQSEKLSREGGDVSVHSWQNNVEKIIVKVSRLDEEYSPDRVEEVDKLQKEVVERFAEAKRLKKAREEKEISIQLIQEEPWSQSIKSLQPLDSRTSILEEIMAKLREPDTDIIGIHGLGGIGKTTLAKQVANRCMEEQIVDKFAFVEVSQLPNVKKIQQEIGCKLGLSFGENENIPQRARKLHQQLKDSKKTLLILDNVWECFDFESLGIPCKDDRNGLKLLMTARSLDVIKDERGSSSYNFNIEALKWEDAWNLFGRKANISKECKDDSLEVEVAKKCGGMPLAIVTIASALSDKKTHEWRIALRKLSQPSADNFNGVTGIVYGSIELSYEYLKTDELKEAFLLCCSLPNTNDASVEDLLRYGIGLGLFINCQTLEETRDIVLSWLTTLKSSSLLVDAPEHGYDLFPYTERFAVHDVVCEVARSIAQKK